MKIEVKKYIILIFMFIMLLLQNDIYATEHKIEVKINDITQYYSNISDAISDVIDNEETVLKLLSDVEIDRKITIPGNKNIIIDGDNKYSITYMKNEDNTWYTGQLFEIKADANVVFRNLTIDGQNNWTFDNETYLIDIEEKK